MTQLVLANRAGLAIRTIHNAEAGRPLRQTTKRRLLKGLGLRLEDARLIWPESHLGQGRKGLDE